MSLSDGLETRATELYAHVSGITAGETGLVLLGVGATMWLHYIYKMYPSWRQQRAERAFLRSEEERKKKRTQEAMDIREVRLREMLSEIITDGILDRQVKQELSDQEGKRLMRELSLKLNLPDIVPQKTRSKIVKQEIKARRAKGIHKKVAIPGDPPTPAPTKGFVGKLTNKYWRAKTVPA